MINDIYYADMNNEHDILAKVSLLIFFVVVILIRKFGTQLFSSQNEDNKKVRFLACTAIALIGFQILTFVYIAAPENLDPAEAKAFGHTLGIIKFFIRSFIGLAPIGFSIYICNYYWKQMLADLSKGSSDVYNYPTLMVAQGTFYTFVGVSSILLTYSLSSRNTEDLISGLKLAFITSVIGLIYSIAAKTYISNYLKNKICNTKPYLNDYDFYNILSQLNSNIIDLKNSLSSDLKNMADNQKEINNMLFKRMSEHIETSAMAAAKQNKEFNEELVKNVATVFQELDSGMKKTVESFNNNIDKATVRLENKINKSISNIGDKINDTINTINGNINSSISNINKNIEGTVKNIDENINYAISHINTNMEEAANNIKNAAQILEVTSKKSNDVIIILNDNMNKTIEFAEKTIASLNDSIKATESNVANMSVAVNNFQEQYKSTINAISRNNNNLNITFTGMNDTLRKLTISLEELNSEVSRNNVQINSTLKAVKDKVTELENSVPSAASFSCFNNSISSFSRELEANTNKISELTEVLNISVKDIVRQDKIVKNSEEKIIEAFNNLGNKIYELNSNRSLEMIEEQKKYAANLHDQTIKVVEVIGDIAKASRDEYIRKIKTLDEKINTIQTKIEKEDEV